MAGLNILELLFEFFRGGEQFPVFQTLGLREFLHYFANIPHIAAMHHREDIIRPALNYVEFRATVNSTWFTALKSFPLVAMTDNSQSR
jgi:hypothetical protein